MFTRVAATEIRRLLQETRRSPRERQKRTRQAIRDLGFYISDWTREASGFRPEDFDDLVARKLIRIID